MKKYNSPTSDIFEVLTNIVGTKYTFIEEINMSEVQDVGIQQEAKKNQGRGKKVCPQCSSVLGVRQRVCPSCSYSFPIKTAAKPAIVTALEADNTISSAE